MKRCKYDPQADAVYVYFNNKPYAFGKELDEVRRIDYAVDNTPIGIEILSVSKGVNLNDFPYQKEIMKCLQQYNIKIYA